MDVLKNSGLQGGNSILLQTPSSPVKETARDIKVVSPGLGYEEFKRTHSSPIRISPEPFPASKISRSDYENWQHLEEDFNEKLASFFIKSLNEKGHSSSKIFVMKNTQNEQEEINLEEDFDDDSSIELEDSDSDNKNASAERARDYFINKLEEMYGSEAIKAVYPLRVRNEPLTPARVEATRISLLSLRDKVLADCKGGGSEFTASLNSHLALGQALQEQLDQRFSPKKN